MTDRRPPPNRRRGVTTKLVDDDLKVHATVNLYPDGRPAELFLAGPKPGSPTAALLEDAAVLVSVAIQHGVPVAALAKSLARLPAGPLTPQDLAVPNSDPTRLRPASILGKALDFLLEVEAVAEGVKGGALE